jgi:hypothetical protein
LSSTQGFVKTPKHKGMQKPKTSRLKSQLEIKEQWNPKKSFSLIYKHLQ